MVYSLRYRRPSYRDSQDSIVLGSKQKPINESISSNSEQISNGIPSALSFDRIVSGGTCPPCTVREFVNYLKYIELSAENLQFYLWLQDYTKRFEQLSEYEKALSPEWKGNVGDVPTTAPNLSSQRELVSTKVVESHFEHGNEYRNDSSVSDKDDPFRTSLMSDQVDGERSSGPTLVVSPAHMNHMKNFGEAFDEVGVKLKPFTVQPYREEIGRIISIYISDGGARQLNLSSRERATLLHALDITTHPSAFGQVQATVEWTLRHQAHPNFIRWTICNGNQPRIIFARSLGIITIIISLIAAILITLSSAARSWRILPFVGFFIGISTLIAAWKGMCVVLHGMHHRHIRPWELFEDEPDPSLSEKSMVTSVETLNSSNSYEDEPWIANYRERNLIRKIFDREVWVKEKTLRRIQDTIFVQAVLGGFFLSAVIVGMLCAFPPGKYY